MNNTSDKGWVTCSVLIGSIVICHLTGIIFGEVGFITAIICSVFAFFGYITYCIFHDHIKKREEESLRAKAPCMHGRSGAVHNPSICPTCVQEKQARELAAQKAAEEAAARQKAQREEEYRQWVRKMRLPDYLQKMDPREFELTVCKLFARMGYKVEMTPYSGDGGIDGRLFKDGALSILQCKRVQQSVGQPVLRDLFGTMNHEKASEGIVVTTGNVSEKAREWSQGKAIRIIEMAELISLIRQHFQETDVVPDDFTPDDHSFTCPRCGHSLRKINWKNRAFIGCSNYPRCRYTRRNL